MIKRFVLLSLFAASIAAIRGYHLYLVFANEFSSEALLAILLPTLFLFSAFFIGFMKPEDDHAFRSCILFGSFSFVFGMPFKDFPSGLREFGLLLRSTCVSFLPYLFTNFFFFFPTRSIIHKKFPWLRKALLILTLVLWPISTAITFSHVSSFALFGWVSESFSWSELWTRLIYLSILSIGLTVLVLHTIRAENQDERRKTGILLAGALIGLVPLATFLTVYPPWKKPPFELVALLALTVAVFPLSFLYVVLKHRVMGARLILRRGLQYALVSRAFFVIEGIGIFIVLYLLLGTFNVLNYSKLGLPAVTIAVAAFAMAAGLKRLNAKAMASIDRRFFREAYNANQILTDLGRAVRRLAAQPEKLFDLVTDKISDSLYPDKVAVFLHRERSNPEVFQCQGMRVRSNHQDEVWCDPAVYQEFQISSQSLLAQQLKKFANEDPECLDVYPDDPKSWAHALMKLEPSESKDRELELIEKLNAKLIVPLTSGNRILGLISLGEKLSEEIYSKEDRQMLISVAEQTAIALEYSDLIRQVADQEKLKRELQIAAEVQAQLFPQVFPKMKSMQYSGYCKAALAIGGDYFDFLSLDSDTLGIALGDVSGKGISAALLMANLQALLRSGAPLRAKNIDVLLGDMNRLICASTTTRKYATFFYSIYSDKSKLLAFVNAGHLPPMLFHSNSIEPERLTCGGPVVGMLPNATYKKGTVELQPGDILLIYSDGLSEAMNVEDEEFGENRIVDVVNDHRDLPVEGLRDAILESVSRFVKDAPQHDDLTLVVAKVMPHTI